ncbi:MULTISPECIES: hypothetical protein [unclassified Brenneria]|nr:MULTISPECIES: hypothetical protein [unclassified Brenneria]MBJ7223223.1 hypothetical protein [Brenneria sp. L3-3C-1]MEE3644463.1 hypothetical protein [Brenneria sp. L3_3C_1]MEE3652025.1 hypothetical protein [Brenneria sp. HEZEL_4_2_4]NPD01985.1 hypothetical protein [Brenneria sp. hezel4-2-4]
MRIGVGGANGQLGQAVLKEWAERAIIALLQTPEKAPAGVQERFTGYKQ